jgi:hypothetical protein
LVKGIGEEMKEIEKTLAASPEAKTSTFTFQVTHKLLSPRQNTIPLLLFQFTSYKPDSLVSFFPSILL